MVGGISLPNPLFLRRSGALAAISWRAGVAYSQIALGAALLQNMKHVIFRQVTVSRMWLRFVDNQVIFCATKKIC